jgi:hypothetical protein
VPEILPRILYQNLLVGATLTASPSSTEADGPVATCREWKPWTFWRPTGSAPWTLEVDFGSAKDTNAAALYGHDCDDTVAVDRWDGAAWVEVATTEADGAGDCIWLSWDEVSTSKLRFRFDDLSHLAILCAGLAIELPEGIPGGWSDPDLAQRAQLEHQVSRGGVWLGNVVERWEAQLSLALKNVAQEWVRDTWRPFLRTCSAQPFFLHWDADEWPNSACLCTSAEFGDTAFSQRQLIDLSVSFQAETGRRAYP